MNIKELHDTLQSKGVSENEYHLHGLYGSVNDDDKIALNIIVVDNALQYEVYYKERGIKSTLGVFYTEREATHFILEKLGS